MLLRDELDELVKKFDRVNKVKNKIVSQLKERAREGRYFFQKEVKNQEEADFLKSYFEKEGLEVSFSYFPPADMEGYKIIHFSWVPETNKFS